MHSTHSHRPLSTLATVTALGLVLAASLVATPALGQRGPGNGRGSSAGTGVPSAQLDVLHPVVVDGAVVRFSAEAGMGTPSLVVKDRSAKETTFVLGPFRYLSAQHFAAQAGDAVKVTAFPCTGCESELAPAQVVNVTKGITLDLRAADGTPLFSGNGNGNGMKGNGNGSGSGSGSGNGMNGAGASCTGTNGAGMRGAGRGQGQGQGAGATCDGSGPDVSRTASFQGTVKSFTGGPGQGRPTLVLATTQGDRSFILSPYRALAASGYTPVGGAKLAVKAAPVSVIGTEEWVAISVTDTVSGLSIELRDPATGLPIGGRGCNR